MVSIGCQRLGMDATVCYCEECVSRLTDHTTFGCKAKIEPESTPVDPKCRDWAGTTVTGRGSNRKDAGLLGEWFQPACLGYSTLPTVVSAFST